ncbi:anaphase-promoting complex subunit 15 [Anopheles cruzii]|uniref:anaphase-promoting complex subunit 15 n=1 Tax=Anopheles cruzii TaxID=68878 RepID=UPI0022EC1B51|nr:anaphase-promoting complex subunit 15 [Anopheles cruzii]
MIPFFPSLQPSRSANLWFAVDESYDDDAEVSTMEADHQDWLNRIGLIGADLTPIGKSSSEHMENMDTEDEDANDESDDSDNSDEDDDEMEDMNGRNIVGNDAVMDDMVGNDTV